MTSRALERSSSIIDINCYKYQHGMVHPFRTAGATANMAEDKRSVQQETHNNVIVVGNEDGNKKEGTFPALSHWRKKSCAKICGEICYVLLGLVTLIFCIAEIIVTILASVANKLYDAEQSGHMVAMVVLAVTGAITLSIIIYSMVGVCRTHSKPLHMTAFVLVIIAIIQALLTGLVVNVSDADHFIISKSLAESFKLAREGNSRHVSLWSSTQSNLQCCGLYGAEDYRTPKTPPFFPPNIPISCCISHDPKKPDSAQERERELCKAQRDFYEGGCKPLVLEIFAQSSLAVVVVTSMLIVFELLSAISAAILSKKKKRRPFKVETPDTKDSTEQKS